MERYCRMIVMLEVEDTMLSFGVKRGSRLERKIRKGLEQNLEQKLLRLFEKKQESRFRERHYAQVLDTLRRMQTTNEDYNE